MTDKEFKHKIIDVKIIKKEEDLMPILKDGIDKEFNLSEFKWTNRSEKILKEFIKKDWKLIELYFEGKIDFHELIKRRNKLIGKELSSSSESKSEVKGE